MILNTLQIGSVVMMSKRKSRNQLKVSIQSCEIFDFEFFCFLQVPKSSLPISPMHGPGKLKLKKAAVKEKAEEVDDLEKKSKAEDDAEIVQSCDSVTSSSRLK